MLKPANARQLWPRIASLVEDVLEAEGESIIAADVYAAIVHGTAFLWADEGGFVVLREDRDRETGALEVLVWIGVSYGGGGALEHYTPQVEAIARQAGAVGIAFHSSRAGYERALPEGWKKQYTRWHWRIR